MYALFGQFDKKLIKTWKFNWLKYGEIVLLFMSMFRRLTLTRRTESIRYIRLYWRLDQVVQHEINLFNKFEYLCAFNFGNCGTMILFAFLCWKYMERASHGYFNSCVAWINNETCLTRMIFDNSWRSVSLNSSLIKSFEVFRFLQ